MTSGRMLGRYELLSPIATGGMGKVWAARLKGTRGFRKLVAIKTVLRLGEDAKLEQMLLQEAMLASQVHHPNVVETIELGEQDGSMFLVMELIEGESLGFVMREAAKIGGVPLKVAVNLIGQVCRGLSAAHQLRGADDELLGLIHRDISPPNLLVTPAGTLKIVDFGVATTSSSTTLGSGEIKGKISYLAPEQLRGDPLDARVDVFATGIVLYQLTVGRHPFKAPTEAQTLGRILGDSRPTPPSAWVADYPEMLEHVVLRALEKNPRDRWDSAAELLTALDRAVPEALGPAGERLTAEFMDKLLASRLAGRRATLRLAEEETELTAAAETAAGSLPAVVSSSTHAPARRGRIRLAISAAAGMACALLLAVGLPNAELLRSFASKESRDGSLAHREQPRTTTHLYAAMVDSTAEQHAPTAPAGVTPRPLHATASVVPAPRPVAPRERAGTPRPKSGIEPASEERGELEAPSAPPGALALVDSGLVLDARESESSSGQTGDVQSAVVPSAPPSFVPAVVVPPTAPTARPLTPRALTSREAHRRLTIDPRAESYRVELPPALAQSRRNFAATVRICVSSEGKVSSVNVTRPAGPAIDAQLPEVLGRWRYAPLVEDGRSVPFCYSLRYELVGR
ncbi:MAG TPA: protein kinase [Polyangiaceae bacterium]